MAEEQGGTWRADGFFDKVGDGRSPAEEFLEGVMLHAANSYQELKLPFYGRLGASVILSESATPAMAHQLLALLTRLTVQRMAALTLFALPEERSRLQDGDYRGRKDVGGELAFLLTDIYGLYLEGILRFDHPDTMLGVTCVNPGHLLPQGIGSSLISAAGLVDAANGATKMNDLLRPECERVSALLR